jgi:uncharacterized membrane protein
LDQAVKRVITIGGDGPVPICFGQDIAGFVVSVCSNLVNRGIDQWIGGR